MKESKAKACLVSTRPLPTMGERKRLVRSIHKDRAKKKKENSKTPPWIADFAANLATLIFEKTPPNPSP
jgi:hypothetical protein